MELLASVGVPPVDVIRAATLHAATRLNREEEAGNP
jgi:imidazolonepropionase-like amidohydrolase